MVNPHRKQRKKSILWAIYEVLSCLGVLWKLPFVSEIKKEGKREYNQIFFMKSTPKGTIIKNPLKWDIS